MGKLSAQLAQCFTDANCTQHNVRLHQVSQPGRRGLVREPNEKNNPTHGRRAAGHTRKSVLVERYATRNYVLGNCTSWPQSSIGKKGGGMNGTWHPNCPHWRLVSTTMMRCLFYAGSNSTNGENALKFAMEETNSPRLVRQEIMLLPRLLLHRPP